jgi:transaldolase
MNERLLELTQAGVSIWLDDLSRSRIDSGNLADLIQNFSVRGVTTNPTIFAAALKTQDYLPYLIKEKEAGSSSNQAVFNITTKDVADACDLFKEIYLSTSGVDGRVSIEVSPDLAFDSDATVNEAVALYKKVNRENVMIKIPATLPGLRAITEVISRGISVNVTLIFSLDRYRQVIDAYMDGLDKALENGIDIRNIHSVASFFVSRVDTEIDKRLEMAGRPDLKSLAALANARLAYRVFMQSFESERWSKLAKLGARLQRPLMASTGVKDPSLSDTLYVTGLIAQNLVNTMPEKTMMAFADHGEVEKNSIDANFEVASSQLQQLQSAGIDLDEVTSLLEQEGVEKFIASWRELIQSVDQALKSA